MQYLLILLLFFLLLFSIYLQSVIALLTFFLFLLEIDSKILNKYTINTKTLASIFCLINLGIALLA